MTYHLSEMICSYKTIAIGHIQEAKQTVSTRLDKYIFKPKTLTK